jgi:hypothetical protein
MRHFTNLLVLVSGGPSDPAIRHGLGLGWRTGPARPLRVPSWSTGRRGAGVQVRIAGIRVQGELANLK